ncbi:TPA: ash family protein [Escherichia coli]|nr:hypothetical protein [Escherichia coli]ELM8776651.1 ash family protein [Escherichia coli]EMA4402836.1 ash family protein [Escherichia coli]HAH8501011.1 ash family protein [Escherichia coli]HEL5853198.1 ash family protein [Escherichia coli]
MAKSSIGIRTPEKCIRRHRRARVFFCVSACAHLQNNGGLAGPPKGGPVSVYAGSSNPVRSPPRDSNLRRWLISRIRRLPSWLPSLPSLTCHLTHYLFSPSMPFAPQC